MQLKTKLSLGLGFLLGMIIVFGILGIFYINRLSNDADQVLKNNHESLMYCNDMLAVLDRVMQDTAALQTFNSNLLKQESNITEAGELEATAALRKQFNALQVTPSNISIYTAIRQSINHISSLNLLAILKKNSVATNTGTDARRWLTILFTILLLVAVTFVYNLPGIISDPIEKLSEGFSEIANKNYRKRIYLKQGDEFGQLAATFNSMAEKLDEYEHSNLAKIKFEKSRIETIINQMKDGIVGLDEKNNILFLNAVAERMMGLKERDIVGKYAPDISVVNDLMRTLLQEPSKKELKIYADSKESYFNKDEITVTTNREIIGKVIVLRNITPFHELNEAKTNFIATVSHELKTPISAIKMSARLLTDIRVGPLNHEQQELTKSIEEDAERLLKITGELLTMSQVETGNIQLKLQTTYVAEIINQAVQAVQPTAQQKGLRLLVNAPPHLPAVQADGEKTSWVLINFLTNAIKYSHQSGIIEIIAMEQDGRVRFSVRDYGSGIEDKYMSKIFDRYFKVPGTQDRNGTGLGLAISKEFIEAQHGHIEASSVSGEGSIFGFDLPIAVR